MANAATPPGGYRAEISRVNPTCFLFVIDQSDSMADPFAGQPDRSKADEVASVINRLLQTLVLRCARGAEVLDRFQIGVIGYGGNQIAPALGGPLAAFSLMPVSALAKNPLRIEERIKRIPDGVGGLVEHTVKFPVWFEPVAGGNTPMCQALAMAGEVVSSFLASYPACYPPLVINITDGEANDGDPGPAADALRGLASSDGHVLLYNAHISSLAAHPVEFPDKESDLPEDRFARQLFRMSSILPPSIQDAARREGFRVSEGSHGFVFNADLISVIRFLDIGTRVDARNLR